MWIFAVFYILLGSCCLCATGQTYSFSDAPTDWSSAGIGCHPAIPATPPIRYTSVYNESFSFLIDTESLPDLEGANLWVGYYASNQVFKYEGCVYEPNVQGAHVASHRVARRPGACYSACGRSPLFGMLYKDHSDERHNCICYDEAPNTSLYRTVCTMTCTQPHVACGNYYYISLYSHVPTTTSFQRHQSHPGDCVSYTPDGSAGDWYLTLCDIALGVLCEVGNHFWEPPVQPRDWLSTSKYCFTQAQHPARVINETMASYENELGVDQTRSYWTGLFIDLVIHSVNEAASVAPEQYGYLETRDDDVYLKFTPDPNPHRKVLCGTGFTTTTRKPNTATKRRDTTPPVTTAATEALASATSDVTMTTGHDNGNPEATSSRLTNTPSDGDDNVPVIAGTCIGLFVLIVIVVVVGLILWKRRKNHQHLPTKRCHDIKLDNDVGPTTTDYHNVDLPTVTVTVPNNTPDHIYAQVQKKKKNTNNAHSTDTPKVDQVYNIVLPPEEDTYDHTNQPRAVTQCDPTGNQYSTLAVDTGTDTYDHAAVNPPTVKCVDNVYNEADAERDITPYDVIGKKSDIQVMSDNVYNTTKERCDNGSVYDHTNVGNEVNQHTDNLYDKTRPDNAENMYDETNVGNEVNQHTDNLYDKTRPDNAENMYDETNVGNEVNQHTDNLYDKTRPDNAENMYDETNSSTKQTPYTDNIYTTVDV